MERPAEWPADDVYQAYQASPDARDEWAAAQRWPDGFASRWRRRCSINRWNPDAEWIKVEEVEGRKTSSPPLARGVHRSQVQFPSGTP